MSDNESAVQLSNRELQVLEMVATGASNQQIARRLVISVNTVKVHLRNIFEKLEVQSRTEATLRAINEGWIVVDNQVVVTDQAVLPAKTYLLSLPGQPALARWQQIYLIIASLLALAMVIIPLIPRSPVRSSPNLPVIYAQPPTPIPANSGSKTWRSQSPMPSTRAGLGLVAFDGQIFAIGGVRGNNQATRLVEIYDPATENWSIGAAKPTAAANIAGAVINDEIYVPGGCTNEGQATDILEIYSPKSDSWREGESLPEARCGYGLVAVDDKLYLLGGWNGETFEDTVFEYSPEENAWAVMNTKMPQAKGYVGAAVLDGTIYVVGGYDGETEFNQTYIFSPKTGGWIEKAPLQKKRGGLGLISAADSLFAIGGGWQETLTIDEKYNPKTNTWTQMETPFDHQWRNMGLAVVDTKIYAVGGWDGTNEEYMDSVVTHQFLYQLFIPISVSGEK